MSYFNDITESKAEVGNRFLQTLTVSSLQTTSDPQLPIFLAATSLLAVPCDFKTSKASPLC